jgi:transposase
MINNLTFMDNLLNEVLPQMNPYPQTESVLIMDNAATHNHQQVYDLCDQFGVLAVFLPPYSYNFNPIELAFHQAKQYIRTKWGFADGNVKDRLFEAFSCITSNDAVNYFSHCLYKISNDDMHWRN